MLTSALAFVLSSAAPADEPAPSGPMHQARMSHGHTHAPGEIDEDHGPLLLQLSYTGDLIGSASGGRRRGTRYLDNLDIVFEADMDHLVGWRGAQVHVYGLYNNGKSISDFAGDTQAVSNIETGVQAFRLYEAWIDQRLGDRVSVKAGLYDLNSEFDALDAAGLFTSSPNGIGTDFAQSGKNGPSIFPATALAARLQVEPAKGWAIRTAVLDGVPGDPDRPRRTAFKLGDGDGALLVGEVQAPLGGGKLLMGHWRYTASFERNDGSGFAHGNTGNYIRAEMPLAVRDGRTIDGFVRFGTASGRFNMFDAFAGGGLKFSGWIAGRDADEFGLAVASAFTSESYRAATGASSAEVAVEATYRTPVTRWLSLQPNIHYIRRPSANPRIKDVLLLGLRAEISFTLIGS